VASQEFPSGPPPKSEDKAVDQPASRPGWLARLASTFGKAPERPAEGDAGTDQPAQLPSSQEIFKEIGEQLRKRRGLLSLTHEEIEQHIHVRAEFLAALEQGAFDQLPSPVQARGMLANYASFLDLEVDTLLLRFADALQQGHRERHPVNPARTRRSPLSVSPKLPPLRTFIAGDMVFGIGVAVLLGFFAVWGVGRVISMQAQIDPNVTAPPISEVLAETSMPTELVEVTLLPVAETPFAPLLQESGTEAPTLDPNIALQVNIVAVELTYMRVTVDGEVVFNGRVVPGTAYPFDAEDQVEILTGNAAALRVTYNGHDLGLMGNFGQVVDRVYTAEGVVTPTSTRPPTATLTPNYTRTPTFTPSATPTITPTIKP